jgi:hypothetical protein
MIVLVAIVTVVASRSEYSSSCWQERWGREEAVSKLTSLLPEGDHANLEAGGLKEKAKANARGDLRWSTVGSQWIRLA